MGEISLKYNWNQLKPKQEDNLVEYLKKERDKMIKVSNTAQLLDPDTAGLIRGKAVLLTDILASVGAETKEHAKSLFQEVKF